jgi:HD-GYP domain-containing protein (c-di-GMP phosphodiesterase class II)
MIDSLTHPAFAYNKAEFQVILKAEEGITNKFISEYAKAHSKNVFVHEEDYEQINFHLKEQLTKLTRSLSIGDVEKNATKQVNLLTMQMANLYKDPYNDELLTNQFQNSKNLGILLSNNKGIHKQIYQNLSKQSYHYTHKQPLLSSIMLLSFIQKLNVFSESEIQGLFLTSYFKDIGMSFIPREKLELGNLGDFDKDLFADHATNSMNLLDGRVPLSQAQLNIIKNHHFLNYKIQSLVSNEEFTPSEEYLSGIESSMVSAIDILVAMTTERPYRDPMSSFQALELLKKVLADDYPQEFKTLVFFLKNFFQK